MHIENLNIMKRETILIFFLLTTLTSGVLLGEKSPELIWKESVRQYRKGHFLKAIKGFESLLAAGQQSADLYYNLGNAYVKTQAIPKAILMYEKALKLDPSMDDARHNLQQLRDEMDTDIIEIRPFFLTRWWRNWLSILSPNIWSILAAISFLGLGWTFKRYLTNASSIEALLSHVFVVLLLMASAYSSYSWRTNYNGALVYPEASALYQGPDIRSASETEMPPGIKLHILDSIGDWYKVTLPDKQIGWVPDTAVVKI